MYVCVYENKIKTYLGCEAYEYTITYYAVIIFDRPYLLRLALITLMSTRKKSRKNLMNIYLQKHVTVSSTSNGKIIEARSDDAVGVTPSFDILEYRTVVDTFVLAVLRTPIKLFKYADVHIFQIFAAH